MSERNQSVALSLLNRHACFGGEQRFYEHQSREIGLPMRFGLYLPPQCEQKETVPAVMYLAGLTCNEETFAIKAAGQRIAARLGLALITPDTSPRGAKVPGEADEWDFGVGAGFYLDATKEPWAEHWRMESYVIEELLPLISQNFPIDGRRIGIMGHSMGGHGALSLAYKYPDRFKSLSALAPLCAPTQSPWGEKAFTRYLGEDRSAWHLHDATELISRRHQAGLPALYPQGIRVDQGLADRFLKEQLHAHLLEKACLSAGQSLTLARHADYDHGYYFVSSFTEIHLQHHAASLCLSDHAVDVP